MRRLETKLDGPILIELVKHGDERGFFSETYRKDKFAELGVADDFVQDNHSRSAQNIVRGMHFQLGDGVAKLVRCGRGAIYDAVVDLRKGSPTYGQAEGFELSEDNMRVLYCPVGFGHGFCVLSDLADVTYLLSSYYDPETEAGIAWDDPDVGIDWPVNDPQTSERDDNAPKLADIADELPF